MDRLYQVERRRGVAEFADAIVERSLAAADAAKVEAQHCETARDAAFVHRLGDAVVHRSAALWMRMQAQRDRRAGPRRGREAAFDEVLGRSKERCVGHECVSMHRSMWSHYTYKKKK